MKRSKTYNWTTQKGAKIEMTITVNHITKETTSADGWEMECSCNKWIRTIDEMKVNGKNTELKELWFENGTDCVLIETRGKDRVLIAIPSEVAEEIYGEERRAEEHGREVYRQYRNHYNAVRRMMDE